MEGLALRQRNPHRTREKKRARLVNEPGPSLFQPLDAAARGPEVNFRLAVRAGLHQLANGVEALVDRLEGILGHARDEVRKRRQFGAYVHRPSMLLRSCSTLLAANIARKVFIVAFFCISASSRS